MAVYKFKAKTMDGRLIEGLQEAESEQVLRDKLDREGVFVLEVSSGQAAAVKKRFFGGRKVKLKDLSIFCWQLFTMINSGMTLIESLRAIHKQTQTPALKSALGDVVGEVEKGAAFSQALSRFPNVFPALFVQLINAGEISGTLDKIMERLASFLEHELKIRSKIKGAMTYPSVLLFISLGVCLFLVCVILPRFSEMFSDMGMKAPFITRFMLGLSSFIIHYFYLIILGIVGLVAGVKHLVKTPKGRYYFDKAALKTPLFGPLVEKSIVSSFTLTFGTLINAGIGVVEALDITAKTVSNSLINGALIDAKGKISKGQGIAVAFESTHLFPEMVVNMVRVGEQTGTLDKMLGKVAEFFDREMNETIEAFTKLIEPVFLVGMSVIVGFICLSIFLPLTEMMQQM